MRKKVAVVSGLTYPVPLVRGGGPQIVLYNTCLKLDDPDIDWYVLANWDPALDNIDYDRKKFIAVRTSWIDKAILKTVNFLPHRVRKWIFSEVGDQNRLLYNIKIVRSLLFRNKDIIVCHESYSLSVLIHLLFPRKRILSYFHNSKVHRDFNEIMWKRLVRASTAGIVMGAKAALVDVYFRFPDKAVKDWVIHNGVDVEKYNLAGRICYREQTRRLFQLEPDDFVFLFCGRITPIKNIDRIISSFLQLADDYNRVKLVVVGSAKNDDFGDLNYENQLHQMIPEEHRSEVCFVGFFPQEELPKVYSVADCGVLATTLSETVTLFLLECMACGIPVIAPRVGGIPEVVRDGREGVLINKDYSQEDLTNAMKQMIAQKQEWAARSNEIEAYIQNNFSWERVAKEFTKVLYEV